MRELFPETDLAAALAETERDENGHGYRPYPKGGTKHVHMSIGMDGCWCGQAQDHDWPGKADGSPHPRYPV